MHRYQPNIHIMVHAEGDGRQRRTFSFPNTAFMAVTAYQNHRVNFFKNLLGDVTSDGLFTFRLWTTIPTLEGNEWEFQFLDCDC